ncbi:hypothetical protein H1P_4140008 [Hyella patelloides LEGE 07179]|uniref:Uncharacterized protein n=1 Tax=Hyella patelloides LEGE 07179 TaxID=945734 RepID=A0A563VXI7_9CYAN|nr:hypothetical protein [Hyella patelloides]VEP16174.1 hypothetical protein H1P_4140008 [Hyella patelloides LEGE 07179]
MYEIEPFAIYRDFPVKGYQEQYLYFPQRKVSDPAAIAHERRTPLEVGNLDIYTLNFKHSCWGEEIKIYCETNYKLTEEKKAEVIKHIEELMKN